MTATDTHTRSWAKALSWRVLGLAILMPMIYFVTGSLAESISVAVTFTVIRLVLYYFHERFWEGVHWGREVHPLSKIPLSSDPTARDMEIIKDKLRELGRV